MKNLKHILFTFAAIILAGGISFAQTTVSLDKNSGTVEWEGSKIGGSHDGEIDIKAGSLKFTDGKLSDAHVKIDMASIVNHDLDDPEYNQKLVNHLKSDDFFSVDKYPEAEFKSKSIVSQGSGKYLVKGDMTIKGQTHPVEFVTTLDKKGNKFTAKSTFEIDRSKYNVRYGSKSFFDNLGDKVIYDDFEISFVINEMM